MEKTIETLIPIIKRKCNVTWENETTNKRIEEIVEEAIYSVCDKIGLHSLEAETLTKPGRERELFKNYCLYAWNNMTHEFDENYRREILQIRRKYEGKVDDENQDL